MNEPINRRDDPFGVIAFTVEADTFVALKAVANIIFTDHSKGATHFRVEPADEGGGNRLRLLWHDDGKATPLPYPLTTPQAVADFVASWLEHSAVYPKEQPDTDGSVKAGFRATDAYNYTFAVFDPCWIVYGK